MKISFYGKKPQWTKKKKNWRDFAKLLIETRRRTLWHMCVCVLLRLYVCIRLINALTNGDDNSSTQLEYILANALWIFCQQAKWFTNKTTTKRQNIVHTVRIKEKWLKQRIYFFFAHEAKLKTCSRTKTLTKRRHWISLFFVRWIAASINVYERQCLCVAHSCCFLILPKRR